MQKNSELWTNREHLKSVLDVVKRLAARFTARDVLDPDDVVQNAMIKLLTAKELGRKSFWLSQLVKNSATDSLRKYCRERKHVVYHGQEFVEFIDGRKSWLTKSELEKFADEDELHEAIRRLSPEARQVICLLADDYTYGEIAAATKVKLGVLTNT